MLKYVLYVLMFAVIGAGIYIWGLKKAQNQSVELAKMLYTKCEKLVCKELKKKEYLCRNEIEQLVKDVRVGQFYSRNKIGVTNPKEFMKVFLDYMIRKGTLEERMLKGKKVYCRKREKEGE